MNIEEYRRYLDSRIKGMQEERAPVMQHWKEIADFTLIKKHRWLNGSSRPLRSTSNPNIIDSTGTLAARTLAGGMMAGTTTPLRKWFKLKITGFGPGTEVATWLEECEKRMAAVFQESNFYASMAMLHSHLPEFGSACVIIYEDYENVINCYNANMGEFYFALDARGFIRTVGRELTKSYSALVEQFGASNVSEDVRGAVQRKDGVLMAKQKHICHLIEANDGSYDKVPERFPWREAYWEVGSPGNQLLSVRGFNEWPCMTPRWETDCDDPYGSNCPGMEALGDIKQLQLETRRKAQGIDKSVNPPMLADITLKNNPMALTPGGVTYVAGLGTGREGAKPVYLVEPRIAEMMEDIKSIQARIKNTYHNDLFTGISDLLTVRTATEIDARREEKLVLLGPVLEHITNEALGQAVDRVWGIMLRGGLFPPIPQELAEVAGGSAYVQADYESMLAQAQKGLATAGIERMWSFAGGLAGVAPEILDKLDPDGTMDAYGTALGVPSSVMRSPDEIKAIREQRSAAQAAQAAPAIVEGAKTLSETDVGGGINALQLALGNG